MAFINDDIGASCSNMLQVVYSLMASMSPKDCKVQSTMTMVIARADFEDHLEIEVAAVEARRLLRLCGLDLHRDHVPLDCLVDRFLVELQAGYLAQVHEALAWNADRRSNLQCASQGSAPTYFFACVTSILLSRASIFLGFLFARH
jgi:hypothetical protein